MDVPELECSNISRRHTTTTSINFNWKKKSNDGFQSKNKKEEYLKIHAL